MWKPSSALAPRARARARRDAARVCVCSATLDPKRASLPPSDNFVSLCDSLVASEKDYADDLDTLLQEYWIPLCTQGVLTPATEIPLLFGNVEKVRADAATAPSRNACSLGARLAAQIALAHVEVLAKLEAEETDAQLVAKYGVFVAEAR